MELTKANDGAPGANGRAAQLPQIVYLELADYCNLNCMFCGRDAYVRSSGDKGGFTDLEKLKMLERPLRAAKLLGLSGRIGEPLLYPKLGELLSWVYEINPDIQLRITTNGTPLSQKMAALLGGHIAFLSISLNASNAEAYARDLRPVGNRRGDDYSAKWENFIRRISEFMEALSPEDRKRVQIQAVVHRDNVDDICDFVRLVAKLGCSRAIIAPMAIHEENNVDMSLYWIKDRYNDAVDQAFTIGAELGVRVDAGRFYTSVKHEIDLETACRDPFDIAYINMEKQGETAPCCQWAEAPIPMDVYSDEGAFERFWNQETLQRLRNKRDFQSCKACGLGRVFDEIMSHFTPFLKRGLIASGRIAEAETRSVYPDYELVCACRCHGLDLPSLRRTAIRLGRPLESLRVIETEGLAALPALDRACWEAFQTVDELPADSVNIALAAPFTGNGWGDAGYDPDRRTSWRALSHADAASVFVRIVPGRDYEVRFVFNEVGTLEAGTLELTACGQPLKARLSVDRAGRVLLAADIRTTLIAPYAGHLWLSVGYAPNGRGHSSGKRVSFSRLEIASIEGGILDIRTRRRVETAIGRFRVRKQLAQLQAHHLWRQAKVYAAVIKADPIGSIPRIKRRIARTFGLSRD